jgi:hypothetical protein
MAGERSRLQVLKEIEALEKKIGDFKSKNDMRLKKSRGEEKKQLQELRDLQQESADIKLKNLNALSSEEKSIGNISGSYRQLQQQQSGILDIAKSLDGLNSQEIEHITSALEASRDLADLSAEDKIQIEEKTAEFNKQLDALSAIDGFNQEILDKLRAQNTEAQSLAGKTKEQKEVLDRSAQANKELQAKMQAFSENVETAITHLTSMKGLLGLALIGAGKLADKFYETNKTLGQVGQGTTEFSREASYLSFIFDDAASSAKDLADNLGGTDRVSDNLQRSTLLIANNMGISASESATLLTTLTYLNKGSSDTAANMAATARSFAKANSIPISSMMSDLAKSTEEFALFGKEGGRNIIEAVGAAKKLGVEMSTISGVADNLLDFETSISKELELSAMLGRNINLSKARQLAFDGDMAAATQETLRQLGGIAEFEKMNYYQKKDAAALMGVSVAELQKMVTNQGSLNDLQAAGNEELGIASELFSMITGKGLGTVLKYGGGLMLLASLASKTGGVVGTMGKNVASSFSSMGSVVGNVMKSVGSGIKGFLGGIGRGIGAFLQGIATGLVALTPAIPVILTLSLAFVAMGFALRLAAPAFEAIGNAIGTTLAGLTSMLGVVTLEKAAAFALLGYSFLGLAVGIGALAVSAAFGGGIVGRFIERIGSLDTTVLSRNAMAVRNFATGIGALNEQIQKLDTEKLEKLEDVSVSLSVGAAISGVASSIGGMIDSASDALFGDSESSVNEKMLAELVLIKQHLATPRVVKIDREKAGQEFAKSTDSSSKNVSSIDN